MDHTEVITNYLKLMRLKSEFRLRNMVTFDITERRFIVIWP